MKTLHILQPYVPAYRVPFFTGLRDQLAALDVELLVFAGTPIGEEAGRNDTTAPNEWEQRITQRSISLGSKRISLPQTGRNFHQADAIIVGLMGSLPQAYLGAFQTQLGGLKFGVWGHVKAYTAPAHPLDVAMERMLMKMSDQVFAYTPGGATFAVESGVEREKVTTVMNTLDTSYARTTMPTSTIARFRELWQLPADTRTFAYIGGLDGSKRVDFLAAALDHVWSVDPAVRVIVAGEGEDAARLAPHVRRGQVVRVGFADGDTKAAIGAISSAILMPGRIGLIACDALAIGIPIVSTRWPFHAPEAEYLREGESVFYTQDDPGDFAHALLETNFVRGDRAAPSLESMIENFAAGVERMLA